MDYKYIEQILESYWNGQTNLEEEQILRSFFSQENVPSHLMKYRALFTYPKKTREEELLDGDFDKRVLAMIEEPVTVKVQGITLKSRLAPFFKAAATVAIILAIGNAAEHSMGDPGYGVEETSPLLEDYYIKKENISSVIKVKDNTQAETKIVADTLLSLPNSQVQENETK